MRHRHRPTSSRAGQVQVAFDGGQHQRGLPLRVDLVHLEGRRLEQGTTGLERLQLQRDHQGRHTFGIHGIGVEPPAQQRRDGPGIIAPDGGEEIIVRTGLRQPPRAPAQRRNGQQTAAAHHARTPANRASKLRLVASATACTLMPRTVAICCAT